MVVTPGIENVPSAPDRPDCARHAISAPWTGFPVAPSTRPTTVVIGSAMTFTWRFAATPTLLPRSMAEAPSVRMAGARGAVSVNWYGAVVSVAPAMPLTSNVTDVTATSSVAPTVMGIVSPSTNDAPGAGDWIVTVGGTPSRSSSRRY